MLSLGLTPEHQYLPKGSFYTQFLLVVPCLFVVVIVFCSYCSGDTPELSGFEGQWSLHSWVPWEITIGEGSWQTTTPRHCIDSRLKCIPSLSVKEGSLLVQELGPEVQASGLAHI